MKPDLAELIKNQTLIKGLTIDKKQTIYKVNEKASGFYFLESGMVGLYRITETGKEHLIRVYGPGEYFGYRSLFSNEPYHLTTRSLKPSMVIHCNINDLDSIYRNAPELLNYLVTSVCKELGEAENRLSNIAAYDSKVRIIDSIVELFGKHHDYSWTSREIAEYSGTETQTVIRFCKQLKQKELLDPAVRGIKPLNLNRLSDFRTELVAG